MAPLVGRLSQTPWRHIGPGIHYVYWRGEFRRLLVGGGFYLTLGRTR